VSDPRATVIIVNFNGEQLLGPCLDALRRQTIAAEVAVWVVDNASTDGSLELLARDFPEARVIASQVNTGFAGGNNLALREVTTPFAVLLNSDTVADPGWLEALLAPFDAPGADRIAAVTSKIVFLPRFVSLALETAGFRPGGADPRELGVRVHALSVDGRPVLDAVLWERTSYGPEHVGDQRFHWTRPAGELLLPVPDGEGPWLVRVDWAAERDKSVRLGGRELVVGPEVGTAEFELPAGAPTVDVVNNVGGVVFADGYGADRGYQQIDAGQFDEPADVFTACGAALALRTEAGRAVGWFDDDFFLYYEDTDLAWRLRTAGWDVRYAPKAIVRHHHSATSREFSRIWFFHVDRNRLLMLTKNATLGLAAREVARYVLTTASMIVRSLRMALRGRRPDLGRLLLRGSVLASYVRLLPRMLVRRRQIAATAVESRSGLQERWLVAR